MTRATIIVVSRAGSQYAVRIVPTGPIDRDRALFGYGAARTYAEELCATINNARIDDRCGGL